MSELNGMFQVQVGKGKSAYKTKYTVEDYKRAVFWFNCLNTHSGHKKRLLAPNGVVIARVIT